MYGFDFLQNQHHTHCPATSRSPQRKNRIFPLGGRCDGSRTKRTMLESSVACKNAVTTSVVTISQLYLVRRCTYFLVYVGFCNIYVARFLFPSGLLARYVDNFMCVFHIATGCVIVWTYAVVQNVILLMKLF
eukprot:GHVR01038707.1.p1 GENE.GHVR01038707.1~~GHVR01038707.1.p1  ORF type:complete len:132 (+),score=1.47 GHVR01038707.1:776-1171(+)